MVWWTVEILTGGKKRLITPSTGAVQPFSSAGCWNSKLAQHETYRQSSLSQVRTVWSTLRKVSCLTIGEYRSYDANPEGSLFKVNTFIIIFRFLRRLRRYRKRCCISFTLGRYTRILFHWGEPFLSSRSLQSRGAEARTRYCPRVVASQTSYRIH